MDGVVVLLGVQSVSGDSWYDSCLGTEVEGMG
jgi:hypothetical protein